MSKKILVDAVYPSNIQAIVVKDGELENIEYTNSARKLIKGNIYLAKITRIEPSLQAAFIDYGDNKNGFIPFSEIHPDYYNVPFKYRHNATEGNKKGVGSSLKKLEEVEVKESLNKRDSGEKDNESIDNLEFEEAMEDIMEESLKDIPSSDENYIERVKQQNLGKYKVQEVLKRNQVLLVQAVKEIRGNKGASFTTYISLAGRYCVVMPNCELQGGISRRIIGSEVRKKLQEAFDEIRSTSQLGLIIRTAGQGKSKSEIKTDYNYLVQLWNNIRNKTLTSDAPAFVYAEDDILKKIVRDLYDSKTKEIMVQGEEAYRDILSTVELMSLGKHVKVNKYTGDVPIFNKFKVNEQIAGLYSSAVYLESGAYIVINHTEALIAIDINSGKSTSERNIEETATKTNIEAAKEIARQIQLRDLSGLIVIDFIDMMEARNKRLVEKVMRDMLQGDKARIQIGHISGFGLLEMSRQRLRPSFLESNTISCMHCGGKGVVKSNETNAMTIFRTIEGEIAGGNKVLKVLNVYLAPEMVLFILNNKRKDIKILEDKFEITIFFFQDPSISLDSFAIETLSNVEEEVSQEGHANDEPLVNNDHEDPVPSSEVNKDEHSRNRVRKRPVPSSQHNKKRNLSKEDADKIQTKDTSKKRRIFRKKNIQDEKIADK